MKFYKVGWDASFFSMRVSGFMSKPDTGPAFACSHKAVDPTCHWMLYQEASMYSQSFPCSPVEEGQAGHSLCSGLQGSGFCLGPWPSESTPLHSEAAHSLSSQLWSWWELGELPQETSRLRPTGQTEGRPEERLLHFVFFFFYPVFSKTINWGPEDSSPQLLFFCGSSSVLFEIWCFRQKKGGQSIERE